MRVFLSWSGSLSKSVAENLREWLPDVIQALDPWMSSEDIEAGSRWSAEIATQLDAESQGIVIVTKANQTAPWLNFEAGALSKSVKEGRPRPLLVDLKQSEVLRSPLTQFQMTELQVESDMLALVKSLNNGLGDSKVPPDRVEKTFAKYWPDLLERLEKPLAQAKKGEEPKADAEPDTVKMLEELLSLVRNLARQQKDTPLASAALRRLRLRDEAAQDLIAQIMKERGPDLLIRASDGTLQHVQPKISRLTSEDLEAFDDDGNPRATEDDERDKD